MRNTELEIKKTFLNLLKNYDIEEIDVKMICESLNIKRQSFYYHYKNIYDVIYSFFSNDDIKNDNEDDFDSIVIAFINYLYSNQEFNSEILKSSAKDVLEEYSFSYFYRALTKYIGIYGLSIDSTKDLSRFLAKATSSQILHYFAHGDYSKDEIYQKITYLVNKENVDYIVRNYKIINK